MDVVEETFQTLEYEKFVLHGFEGLPLERERELSELVQKHGQRLLRKEHFKRISLLKQEPSRTSGRSYYAKSYGIAGVRRYESSSGHTIYRIPVLSFRTGGAGGHFTNCCLIVGRELTLVDCGTANSGESLARGVATVADFYGEKVALDDVSHVVVTHAHIDHFGGLAFLSSKTRKTYVHRDDVRSVENVQAVLKELQETIGAFLRRAGLGLDSLDELLDLYTSAKRELQGFPVTHPLEDGDRIIEDFEVIHVPGHCPGHINIRVGDVLLLGDHILMDITPHQFPKFYVKGMGLVHYLPSLLKVCARAQKIRLGIGGHNEEVPDVRRRALEIIDQHHNRLADLLFLLEEPASLADLTRRYFTEIQGRRITGYERILALEEVQAHMEYLADAMNYVETVPADEGEPGVLRYRRR